MRPNAAVRPSRWSEGEDSRRRRVAKQDNTGVIFNRGIALERRKQANHKVDIDGAGNWIDLDCPIVFNFTDPMRCWCQRIGILTVHPDQDSRLSGRAQEFHI